MGFQLLKGLRDGRAQIVHKAKSNLIGIFGTEVGAKMTSVIPSRRQGIPAVAKLLENNTFLYAPDIENRIHAHLRNDCILKVSN